MLYDVLIELEKDKKLKELARFGVCPATIILQKKAYELMLEEKKKGIKTLQAVCNTAETLKVSERWVFLAKKKMEER